MPVSLADRLKARDELAHLVDMRKTLRVPVVVLADLLNCVPSTLRKREVDPAPYPSEARTYRNALRMALKARKDDPWARLAVLALDVAPSDPQAWIGQMLETAAELAA